jgi:excisionase family DNA binding protein
MAVDKLAYSIPELCEATGFRRTKIYEELRLGNLKSIKLGRRTVIRAEELRRWLATLPAGDFK